MTEDNTFIRSLHDFGAAGRFGSVSMAGVATNRAVGDTRDPAAVGRVTSTPPAETPCSDQRLRS